MNRTEQIVAKALEQTNGDRYILALMISKRAEELSLGKSTYLTIDVSRMKTTDIALLEIAEGKVLLDGFIEIQK